MVIASGSTISRAIFSFCSCAPWPFSRWVRRRNAATERVRSSSPEVALVTVRRPRLRCSPPRGGRGVGTMTFCPGRNASAGRLRHGCVLFAAPGAAGVAGAAAARGARRRRRAVAAAGHARDRRGRRRFAAGKAPSRLVLRLPLEIGFLGAAKLLVALARLGGLAFKAIARLALAPSPGVRLLAAAVLLLLRARVDQRPGARLALLGRQSGQHDAGLGRRRRGGLGGRDRRGPRGGAGRRGRGRRRRRGRRCGAARAAAAPRPASKCVASLSRRRPPCCARAKSSA